MEKNFKSDAYMKPKTYRILAMAVENGISCGWQRAHKHTDAPGPEDIKDALQQCIMTEICEWFTFDDEE